MGGVCGDSHALGVAGEAIPFRDRPIRSHNGRGRNKLQDNSIACQVIHERLHTRESREGFGQQRPNVFHGIVALGMDASGRIEVERLDLSHLHFYRHGDDTNRRVGCGNGLDGNK